MSDDRQDKRATHWMGTAFNSEEMNRLDVSGNYLLWIKVVYGGRETCPTTGKLHYQFHIHCRAQQRFSAIKKWLPTSNIRISNFPADSIAY